MKRTRVKICGITTLEAAFCAVDNGADALGFVFFSPSPRNVTVPQAADITSCLPPYVNKTGVFVNQGLDEIMSLSRAAGLDTIQLHGGTDMYTLSFAAALREKSGLAVYRALRTPLLNSSFLESLEGQGYTLIDRLNEGSYGGDGIMMSFEDGLTEKAREILEKRVIIAGGLAPDNADGVVKKLKPYGLDVSSGVESGRGVKDNDLIRFFLENVRRADSAVYGS